MDYKLSRKLDLNLSMQNNFVRDNYNGYVAHTPYELYTAITAGFTYHFRCKNYKARIADVEPVIEPKAVAAEPVVAEPVKVQPAVAEPIVKKEPAPVAPKAEVVAAPVVKAAPVVSTDLPVNIFFPTNKATIDDDTQRQAVARAAEYLKANPKVTVSLCGYADKTTGTEAFNMNLSAKRAQNVTNLLVTQYGISRNRIKANWYGATVQPFKEDNLNRLVMIK
jgi:OOP family OmpA-OmpF porin